MIKILDTGSKSSLANLTGWDYRAAESGGIVLRIDELEIMLKNLRCQEPLLCGNKALCPSCFARKVVQKAFDNRKNEG